ncbi:hypothetical protein VTI74DRAFT_9289 [Chaetomium olivicolor]
MKGLLSAAALSLAISDVSAHYIFQQLTTGGTKYDVYKYIRKNTNYNSPVTDLTSNDLRCNVGADGASTETVTVKAGDSFTFTLDTPVYHQGPVSIYMSKAPGAASDYDGSGGWFKIKDWGPTFSGGSATWTLAGMLPFLLIRSPVTEPLFRLLHCQHPNLHSLRRLPPPHPIPRHPQPLAGRHPAVLHLLCANHRHRGRQRQPWPDSVHSRCFQGH